ncbi:MAG: hypothetical protein JWQ04_841, partial [Pedosphaera sp.]|nr:hypothetical protein [Pedosphaera sp.]
LTQQWEQLIAWQTGQGEDLECYPQLLPSLLRARGEIGDLRGLTELFERHKAQIAKLAQAETRDQCRLMLFAFCGRRQLVERLFAGSLAMMPAPIREFWLATTDLAAGATESAKSRLEQLLPAADPPMRLAIERRLTRSLVPMEALSESAERLIENAAVEHGHDENFGEGRPLIRKHARATQMLIALNVLMFAAEMHLGGSTDMDALYRLGALYGPAVHGGEWWRLVASLFLHYGPIHLGMNMLALWWLGPFMEFALGWGKFLLVYFITGIGSMGVVMGYASRPDGDQMTVGASGCVMGLIGGTGALMLRAWLRDRAPAAKRRLFSIFVIVATQSAFDLIIPQISMTAHLSGVVIGFAATLALRDRLRIVPPFRPVGGRT